MLHLTVILKNSTYNVYYTYCFLLILQGFTDIMLDIRTY